MIDIEYRIIFQDNEGEIHDFTVEAPDKYIAHDCGAEMMDLDGVKGWVIEVIETSPSRI